jgi:hypothetical protein
MWSGIAVKQLHVMSQINNSLECFATQFTDMWRSVRMLHSNVMIKRLLTFVFFAACEAFVATNFNVY